MEELIDNTPESKNRDGKPQPEKRSLVSTLMLLVVILLCIIGFAYGLYEVLH